MFLTMLSKHKKHLRNSAKFVKHWVNSRTINGRPTFMKAGAMTNRQQMIDDFGLSVAILLGGTNSGQTYIKCSDLAALMEPPPSENCKCLIMKLKVKSLFPTLSSGTNFFIYQLPEGLEIRRILAHGIRMQTFPQTRVDIYQIFTDFLRVIQFNLHLRTEISAMASLRPKLSIVTKKGCNFKFLDYGKNYLVIISFLVIHANFTLLWGISKTCFSISRCCY